MELERYTGIIRRTLVFITLVLFFSCEKPVAGIIDCSECTSDEPVTAILHIRLDAQLTTVNIYEGNLEDSILYESITGPYGDITRIVPINKKYTLTAIYYLSAKYIVVNSVTPHVLYDEESCDEPCYYVYDRVVDLRLKYTR